MEPSSFVIQAHEYYAQDSFVKALEVIEEHVDFVQGDDEMQSNLLQGSIFKKLAEETENSDVKFTYLLGSVECFSRCNGGSIHSAGALFNMAKLIGSEMYYKKSLEESRDGLYRLSLPHLKVLASVYKTEREEMEYIINTKGSRKAVCKTNVVEQKGGAFNEKEEPRNTDFDFLVNGLRSYWKGLNIEFKRNFMKVHTADLRRNVKTTDGKEGEQSLEQALTFAKKNRNWKSWICRTCLKRFSSPEDCTTHLEQEHAPEFKPKDMLPQRISDIWASKISIGDWEPVNAEAAIAMIKNHPSDVKAFAYENGWSKDWPLAVDEERSKLLKEIKLLLLLFCDRKILSCSIRDRLMDYLVKELEKSDLSKSRITDCGLVETPQGICFLESNDLSQILDFLRKINCERDDGKDLVCRAVDSFCGGTRYKENIDFDSEYSTLLLDKRLLRCKVTRFDDKGTVNVFDPNVHYAKARAQGDDFMSWLNDYSSGHKNFQFPRPIRAHNIGIWVAVLRAVQFTCKTMGTKYAKKLLLLEYETALTEARKLCISEDNKRQLKDYESRSYASLLCDRCEEGEAAKTFLCAVRDVLNKSTSPSFDFKGSLKNIRMRKQTKDKQVLEYLELLESEVNNKMAVIDSKILLLETSRISLLNDLTRLALFDYRYYIHHPLRIYLLAYLMDRFDNR